MADQAQIFDDVAFYFFAMVMMGILLLPITLYKIKHCCTIGLINYQHSIQKLHPTVDSIPNYIPKDKLIPTHKRTTNQYLSLKNIFFAFSWLLFLLLLIQLPRWHNSKLIEFDPWNQLGIAKGSDLNTIKKGYRIMAKKYHPDHCTKPPLSWTARKCENVFILVHKAYELLKNDPNWDSGNDPDHTKGSIVMTIGLPTWLLDHPLTVLLIYFGALIILVCIVRFWWQHSAQYHRSGVKKNSIEIFWRFIKPNMMRLRTLLEILSASDEYRILDIFITNDITNIKYKDFLALEQEIIDLRNNRQTTMDNMFDISYINKCCVLLTAHLLGVQIPNSLHDEYLYVLQKAPHLIDVMIDMTLSRERYWFQTLQLIHLKQAIFQGVWPKESILKQLPHWTVTIDKGIRNNGFNNILELNYLNNDQLETLLYKIYKRYSDNSYLMNENANNLEYECGTGNMVDDQDINEMVNDVSSCIRMYPFVEMKYCARTYGEKKIYNNDIVTVTVHLERIQDPSILNQNRFKDVSEMKAPEWIAETKDKSKDNDSEYAKFDADIAEKRTLQIDRVDGPIVHANRFPFRTNEKWLVILIDEMNQTVIDYKAVPDLRGLKKIDLHFAANKQKSGRYPYSIMAICDSYLGAEKIAKFKIYINNKQRVTIQPVDIPESVDMELEDAEPEVYWYYLWNTNFWEFLLTLFLFYFIYLIVIQSSFGKKYLEPLVGVIFTGFIEPVWNLIIKNIDEFIVNPITNQLLKETGFNFIKWWYGIEEKDEMSDEEKDEYFQYAQREYDAMNDE
eukprot:484158_1